MNSLATDNRSRTVDSMSDMRSKVFGGVGVEGEALRASFAPAASGAGASWLSAVGGPLTGSANVRLGGTSTSASKQ